MNRQELYSKNEKTIREWYKNHVPEFCFREHGVMKIKWREPGTWNCAVVYIIDEKMGYLCVAGDMGEAVYQWNPDPPLSINFLGGLSLDYFNGKCMASSCGPRGMSWDPEVAQSRLKDYGTEILDEDGKEKFNNGLDDALEACYSENEWIVFLSRDGYDVFGEIYYELADIGKVISLRCQCHLIGLQMIKEGLASDKFSIPSQMTIA